MNHFTRSFVQKLFVCAAIAGISLMAGQVEAQNLYSKGTGNWDDITNWSLTSHAGLACACTPGAGNTVLIGSGHIITYRSGLPAATTVAAMTIDDLTGGGGTLTFGNGATVTTLTVTGDLLINSGGTLQSGTTGATNHNIQVGGDLTNNNVLNQNANAATNQKMTFTGTGPSNQNVGGTGLTYNFRNFTKNTTAAVGININSSISINGILSLLTNGNLVVGSSANITLQATATITGNSALRYIQLDGTSSTNSQVIRVNSGAVADWQFFFPIGTSGVYSPLDLTTAGGSTMATNPAANATLSVKPIVSLSSQGQLKRTFRLTVGSNASATVFALGSFYYSAASDVSTGDVQANYTTGWYLNNSTGTWTTVTGTAPGAGFFVSPATNQSLTTGIYYYTIGTSTAYPNTWYTYQTGNWSDPNVWTEDPSGTTLSNPLVQPPLPGDQVVILNGFTVTVDVANITTSTMTIQSGAVLDISTFTGHNLGTVDGGGLLRVNGTNLPAGTYTSFVSTVGGTVEYYNTTGTLPSGQTTYNKLLLSNSTASNITFTTINNLTINSTLNITQTGGGGTVTWQINDNTAAQRTMSIAGDVTVSASGLITAGTGNSGTPHILNLSGNLTNSGTIKFFDPTDATYSVANYTAGNVYNSALRGNTVAVTFGGLTSKTVTCNNTTDFYRLILNKGTGQQAILTVNSTAAANFRIFGPANLGSNTGAAPSQLSDCALSLANGTLQLTGTITIPILNTTGATGNDYFSIPQSAALWINGSSVSVTVANNSAGNGDQRIMLDGLLRLTSGTISFGYSKGLGSGDVGIFTVEGGTASMFQFRPRQASASQAFAYNQSGGVVNIGTTGYNGTPALTGVNNTANARFSLPVNTCSFQMTGGILNVGTPTSNAPGGIEIQSSASNYSVSGGTINAYIPTAGSNFSIMSTAPFNNLNVYKEGGGALIFRTDLALTLLGNLTLISANGPTFSCNNLDLKVAGNIDVQNGTTFTPGTNTITINGSGAQSWTHNGTISGLNNLIISKSVGTTLTLGGANTFPNIVGAVTGLTLTSGTLADGGKTLTVTNAITNNAIHSGAGSITVTGPTTIGGTGGTFGNLILTTTPTVTLSGSQTVTGNLLLNGNPVTLNIGSYNLTVLGNITTTNPSSFTTNNRILTSGLHNANGLTRKATSTVPLLFPVGTAAVATTYTPVTITVTGPTMGNITVRPVTGAHPNVTTITQSVQYYWRVTSTGFAGVTGVSHSSYTYMNATRDNATVNYRPARYDGSTFSWAYGPIYNATAGAGLTAIPTFNTGTGWTGLAVDKLDGEYTAGNSAAFGAVSVYYTSDVPTTWGVTSSWSNVGVGSTTHAASIPCATCPVVIGDATHNHTIINNAINQISGTLQIATGSTLDCSTFTGLSFGANTGGSVLGNGTLRIASANFPAGDFINFIGSAGGTVEWYGSTNYTIPTTGPAPQTIPLSTYYNLVINPSATFTITMPQTDLTIYNNFTKSGAGTGQTNNVANRVLSIAGALSVTAGTLSLQNASTYTMSVTGNTTISTGATFTVTGAAARTHTLTTPGTISNGGTMVFRSTAHVVDLTFTGTTPTSLTGSGTTTTLDFINVNKGTSQANVLTVDVTGAMNTLSNNWLTLTNGTINFNNAAYGMTLTNTITNPYTIGSTSRLKVSNGTITISSINADDSDLLLVGTLEVAGGIVTIGSGANNNNDIQYASAGLPSIIVSGGQLNVNGAIRRSTTVLTGALVYNQSSGTVTVGGRNCAVAPNSTRGIFEIENNTGSSFTMSGGTLTVSRPTGGNNFTDLYLNPASSSVAAASIIQVGDNALGAQTLDVNVTPSLGSFKVMGAAGNAQTVNLVSSPLSTSGTLTINTGSTLNTNSLNVSVGGDMVVNGTYNGTIGSGNTTTFNGGGAQAATLSATSTFFNMTVNKVAGTVTMAGTAPTVTDLNILSGTLDVNTLNLVVTGNVTNNSIQSNSGGGSLSMAGALTAQTITSSNGTFGNVTLAGAAGSKVVNVIGNSTINGALNFSVANRYLVIGSYQLTLGTAASVVTPGASDFIRTNGVSSDLGVVKNWAVAGSTLFTYPVGTLSNYTPIAVTLTVTTAGSLTIIPVNSRHPTYNVASIERVLNYYWIVTRNNTLVCSTTGSHIYSYPSALMGGTGGALLAGYLDISNPVGWITGSAGSSANTTTMTFTNNLGTNLPGASNTYHYTVGTINTLPNPIIPVYSRLDDAGVAAPGTGGAWTDPNCWTTSSTGHGAAYGAAPTGVPVVILSGARINMYTAGPVNTNGRVAFTSKIDGVLVLNNSFGHNLGIMSGAGTMRTSTNTFPAGNYTTFVSSAGGTIEYVAPMTMNNRTTYNNLSFSGAGTATMTASDLTLNGSMTIPVGVTVNNASNRNISIARDWSNSGTFTPGTGSVIFTGSLAQGITGATTFYGLTMAGSNNVTLNSTTTVSNLLTMTTGNIVSTVYPAASRLILSLGASVSGGSASSYVDGQMSAILASGSTLTFPLGSVSALRYRPVVIGGTGGPASDTWTSSYIGHNPTTDGFSNLTFNAANMAKVSKYEYWQVANASATATASLTLSWDVGSYGGSDIGLLASMKTARWNGAQWDLPPGGGTFSQTGTNVTGTVTVSFQNAFSPQTLATDDPTSTLPIELLSFDAKVNGNVVDVKWSTATEVNNDYFTIERTVDFEKFEEVKVVKGQGTKTTQTNYSAIDPAPINGRSYYRLKQTDFDGNHSYSGFRTIDFIDDPFKIYPNPVVDHKFTFVLNNAQPSENVILRLVSMQGLTVFEASYKADGNGRINQDIEIRNIASGLYVVDVISSTGLKKKIVIE